MKWLILMMLVACGKHEEPKKLDLKDSDGDQVRNDYEVRKSPDDIEKYIADFQPLKGMKATLQIIYGTLADRSIRFGLVNKSESGPQIMQLLTFNEKTVIPRPYFSEMSRLIIEPKSIKAFEDKAFYDLRLTFHDVKEEPQDIYYEDAAREVKISKWAPEVNFRISREEFQNLTFGKSFLTLRKGNTSVMASIRAKTYRVMMFDGSKTKFLYVSKELPFRKLLKHLRVSPQEISDIDLLLAPDAEYLPQWWMRNIQGDWILVYSDITQLRSIYLQSFQKAKHSVSRIEGAKKDSARITKDTESKVILRFRPAVVVKREFQTKINRKTIGGHDNWELCEQTTVSIKKQQSSTLAASQFFKELKLRINGIPKAIVGTSDFTIKEGRDLNGQYWDAILYTEAEDLDLSFQDLNKKTFVAIGMTRNQCGITTTRLVNGEASMKITVETWVEKI